MKLSEGYSKIAKLQKEINDMINRTKESRKAFLAASWNLMYEAEIVHDVFLNISQSNCDENGKIDMIIDCGYERNDFRRLFWEGHQDNIKEAEELLNKYAPEKITVEYIKFDDNSNYRSSSKARVVISFNEE